MGGVVRPELCTPGPDRLVGDHHTAGNHQLLDVAQTQRETVIQPHRMPDDLDRIPVALVPRCNRHRPILAAPHKQQLDDAPTPTCSPWPPSPTTPAPTRPAHASRSS